MTAPVMRTIFTAVTDTTDNTTAGSTDEVLDRLVALFASAGVDAFDQGVLPDALDELADRLGEETLTGVVLIGAADVLEVADE